MSERRPLNRDERQLAQADKAKREQAKQQRVIELLRSQMSTPQGRAFVAWILSESDLDNVAYGSNALTTYMQLGEQKLGRRIERLARTTCIELYAEMLKERDE